MIDLSGRIALVTGAARGIGFGIAKTLAEAGARVAINDLDPAAADEAAAQLGNGSFGVAGNVSKEEDAQAVVATVVERAGRLDILVNNAGVPAPLGSLRAQRVEDWQRVIDVNLRGVFLMSQAAAGVMQGGAIVNTASIAGLTGFPGSHAYGVSKAGVVMMTKTLATELSRRGIRVNAVAPGVIDAPMLETIMPTPDASKDLVGRVPLGRLGTIEDIGRAAAFLASDMASYITGVVLPVDGGWVAYGGVGAASRPA